MLVRRLTPSKSGGHWGTATHPTRAAPRRTGPLARRFDMDLALASLVNTIQVLGSILMQGA
jgi:hypothetical protein